MSTSQISTDDFLIDLPSEWTERPSGSDKEYLSPTGDEQVIVSVRLAKRPLPPTALRPAVDEMVAARQKSIVQLSGGTGSVLPVKHENNDSMAATTFVGADLVNSVFIFGRVVATTSRIVAVSYYAYGGKDQKTFTTRAEPVCQSLVVKDSPLPRKRWWQWE
jgi:hypothetical protein